MAKEMGTTTRNYEKNSNTQAFIKALEKQIGKDVIEGKNGNASRLYHPRLALDFARWHDPTFAVQLNGVLMAYITGNITSEDSAATARALHEALTGSGIFLPGPSKAELEAKCIRLEEELKSMTKKAGFMSSVFGFDLESEMGALAEEAALPAELTVSSLALAIDSVDIGDPNGLDELNQEDEGFDEGDYISDDQAVNASS